MSGRPDHTAPRSGGVLRCPLTILLCLVFWWLGLRETWTGPVAEGGETFASRTSMELQLALQKTDRTSLKNTVM